MTHKSDTSPVLRQVIQHSLARKNVTFSVLTVGGIDWVCEQLSETQCKPLYPKVEAEAGLCQFVIN